MNGDYPIYKGNGALDLEGDEEIYCGKAIRRLAKMKASERRRLFSKLIHEAWKRIPAMEKEYQEECYKVTFPAGILAYDSTLPRKWECRVIMDSYNPFRVILEFATNDAIIVERPVAGW